MPSGGVIGKMPRCCPEFWALQVNLRRTGGVCRSDWGRAETRPEISCPAGSSYSGVRLTSSHISPAGGLSSPSPLRQQRLTALHRRLLLPCHAPAEARQTRQTRRRDSTDASAVPGADAPEFLPCAPRPHCTARVHQINLAGSWSIMG